MRLKKKEAQHSIIYKSAMDSKDYLDLLSLLSIPLIFGLIIILVGFDPIDFHSYYLVILILFGFFSPFILLGYFINGPNWVKVEVFPALSQIEAKNHTVEIEKDAKFVLSRKYITISRGNNTSSDRILWTISISGEKFLDYLASHDVDIFASQLAEEIVEIFGLTLFDETGIGVIERKPGTTDINLLDNLKNKDVKPFDYNVSDKVEIHEDVSSLTVRISPGWTGEDYLSIIVIIILGGIAAKFATFLNVREEGDGPYAHILVYAIIAFFVLAILSIINYMTDSNEFKIQKDQIIVIQDLRFKNKIRKLDLSQFEFIHRVKTKTDYSVEFVGDKERYTVPGYYKPDEATKLKEILEYAIVKFNS